MNLKGIHYKIDWHELKTKVMNHSKLHCIRNQLAGGNNVTSVGAVYDGNCDVRGAWAVKH
jgi:hypothetical protein